MVRLNPYLNFNGKCREAMLFYQQCLGGELMMQKVSESPMAAQLPSHVFANILHSTLVNSNLTLMGSDMMGTDLVRGNEITLYLNCHTDEEIITFFRKLSDGGEVRTPLHQTFLGTTCGELTDKFGVQWKLSLTNDGASHRTIRVTSSNDQHK